MVLCKDIETAIAESDKAAEGKVISNQFDICLLPWRPSSFHCLLEGKARQFVGVGIRVIREKGSEKIQRATREANSAGVKCDTLGS